MDLDDRRPMAAAFTPHRNDSDGLSVFRASIHSEEDVARRFRRGGKAPTWVARLRVRDVLALGMTVVADPLDAADGLPAQPGHALIPELDSASRGTDAQRLQSQRLALLVRPDGVMGPFDAPTESLA